MGGIEKEERWGGGAEMKVCLEACVQKTRRVNKSVDDSDAPHCNK